MAITATFEEEELSRLYTDVAVGGPIFETGVVGNGKATQQRTINRYDAVRSFEIQFGGLSGDEQLRLQEFFITKFGRAIGFRFYPPNDRTFQNDVIGVSDATADSFDMYLRRNYRSRSRFFSRRIVKPVKDTVVITVEDYVCQIDGVYPDPSTFTRTYTSNTGGGNVHIDWDTGKVTFYVGPPAAGQIVRVGQGEYDLPVYFDVDQFNATDYGPFADWNSIRVTEILPSQITSLGMSTTPLSLEFTSPHSNEEVGATFDVTLDHVGCTKVYLYVDGVLHGSDASAPFTFASVPSPGEVGDIFRVTAMGVNASRQVVEAAIDLVSTTGADTTPPSVPTGLTVVSAGPTSLLLAWDASTD
jgi:uncharacterized protein (TIGR02217 family)